MKTTKQQRDKMRSTGTAKTPLDDVLDDLDDLERTLEALMSGAAFVCGYCDAAVTLDELREHAKVCVSHPCRALERELDKARQYIGISVAALPMPAEPDDVMASVRDLAALRRINADKSLCVTRLGGGPQPWEVYDANYGAKGKTIADALQCFDEQRSAEDKRKAKADAAQGT